MEIEGPQQLGIAPPDEIDAQKTLVVPQREPQGVPHHAGKQAEQHEEGEPPSQRGRIEHAPLGGSRKMGTRHAAGRTESRSAPAVPLAPNNRRHACIGLTPWRPPSAAAMGVGIYWKSAIWSIRLPHRAL